MKIAEPTLGGLQLLDERNPLDSCTVKLILYDQSGVITSGSGFLYIFQNKQFIITNWHVVTGLDFFSRDELISKRVPTELGVVLSTDIFNMEEEDVPAPLREKFASVFTEMKLLSKNLGSYRSFIAHAYRLPLLSDSGTWYEHKVGPRYCDIVAIPFELPLGVMRQHHRAINRFLWQKFTALCIKRTKGAER